MKTVKYLFPFLPILALLLVTESKLNAQEFGSLQGFVSDSSSGEALAYANAYLQELSTGASTDIRGQFSITNIPGDATYTLLVTYVGYKTKTLDVKIESGKKTELYIQLSSSGVELETIEKVGELTVSPNSVDIGLERIDVRKLETLPKSVEADIFRNLQMLPGVASIGDVSGKYYVQGGSADQNHVLVNGVTIYNPYHGMGMFSVVDPDLLNSMDFYSGGFSAEYGSRLSSVLDLTTRDGNSKRFSGMASASYLTGKAIVEGPIPNGSFILSGRKSLDTDIMKNFLNEENIPVEFYDYSFKVNYSNSDFLKNGKFLIFGLNTNDEVLQGDKFKEDYKWKSNLFGLQWYQFYDVPLYSQITIATSSFKGEVIPNLSGAQQKLNEVYDLSIDADFNLLMDSRDEFGFGMQFKFLETKLFHGETTNPRTTIDHKGGNITFYGKYQHLRWENLGIDAGLRVNLVGISEQSGFLYLEPRLSFTYILSSLIKVNGAWGRYRQEVATLADERDAISIFDPYVIVPDYLDPPESIHYLLGLGFDFPSSISSTVTGYYKTTKNLVEINENKVYSWDPDFVSGTGEAYGAEFSAKYSSPYLALSAAYTYSWVTKEVEGEVFHPGYDSRHAFNFIFEWNLGAGWNASAVWFYYSGRPVTLQTGYYDKFLPESYSDNWYMTSNFYQTLILGDKNEGRLPDYHRLDLSLTKRFELGFSRLFLGVSVINAYDRENIFYFDRETGERVNMLPFLPTATIKIQI